MQPYLLPTPIINSDHPSVIEFTKEITHNIKTDREKIIAIYYAVRDRIIYNPYHVVLTPEGMCASNTLEKGSGYCGEKAILMAAAARVLGIPSLLGFANVRNHLATEKFVQLLQSDIFVFHGYTSVYLEGKWIKATPVFNQSLCEKFGVAPLDFDGKEDAIFQEFDQSGNQYMEYLKFYGEFADMPLALFEQELRTHYPHIFEEVEKGLK